MKPIEMTQVIEGKKYSTKGLLPLCGDDWWDGHNRERGGTNTFLYRTAKGNYFFLHRTQWEGRCDHLEPCTEGEAQAFFERVSPHMGASDMSFEEAFPNAVVEEA